jgi:hypothetical protein
MPCPHGHGAPASCSQCLGAVPRKATIKNGRVALDGDDTGTTAEHAARAEEVMLAKPQARRGGAAASSPYRVCGLCGQAGHNRRRCARG